MGENNESAGRPLRVLSLGAGVQSSTLLMMANDGILTIDHAIFADLGWETEAVYQHLEWLKVVSRIPIHHIKTGEFRQDQLLCKVRGVATEGQRFGFAMMPLHLFKDGRRSIIQQRCTVHYKIRPIRMKIKELLGLRRRQRWKNNRVQLLLGISTDETHRMRRNEDETFENVYPLVEMGMDREACIRWMTDHGYPEPPRSSCIGCPFRSNVDWRKLRENPAEWADAVAFDRAIRDSGGEHGQVYLHCNCVPLDQVDLDDAAPGQLDLFGNECQGLCNL